MQRILTLSSERYTQDLLQNDTTNAFQLRLHYLTDIAQHQQRTH